MGVVDVLEVVEVHHHGGERMTVPDARRHQPLEHALEVTTVVQAREAVPHGQLGELRAQTLELRHVAHDGDRAAHVAVTRP